MQTLSEDNQQKKQINHNRGEKHETKQSIIQGRKRRERFKRSLL